MDTRAAPRDAPLYRYRFGTADFDEASFELKVGGLAVDIERKPLELLQQLLWHVGEVVTREELFESVWAGRITVDNVLANAMAKLRKGLGEANAEWILTQPRVGYRFAGKLERVVVGRKPIASSLALEVGTPVPRREHFILEEPLGTSRSSEVWLARHAKTGESRVYKFCPDGERLSSLKREATLSRVLRESLGERADLARVIDWNFETAPFFLECEYGGRNLLQWSDQEPGLAAVPADERIALFVAIAEAVAAAHGVGVLHKDLKPANVLIAARADGGWQPRLTDFGSARLLEPGRLEELGITQLGLTITGGLGGDSSSGTPMYLAPELIAGQAPTVQSDLFALGMMLYQMMAGDLRKPMSSGWERDVGDALLCEDIAQATDGQPARRFGSVTELSTRLRLLDGRRAEKERERAAEQRAREAEQLLQRSRARRPLLLAVAATLVAGLGLSLWLYRQADQARDRAQREATRAEAIGSFLNWEVLANAGLLLTGEDKDPSMVGVLRRASKSVGERFADDPGSEGWIRLAIAEGLSASNEVAAAKTEQTRALQLLEQAGGEFDEKTLDALYRVAETLLGESRFDEVRKVLDTADRGAGASLRTNPKRSLRSRMTHGWSLMLQDRCEEARPYFIEAREVLGPDVPGRSFNAFNVESWIGEALLCMQQTRQAQAVFKALLDAPHDAAELNVPLIETTRLNYGKALAADGRVDEGIAVMMQALAAIKADLGADHPYVAGASYQLAAVYAADGQFARASALADPARALLLAQVGPEQWDTLNQRRLQGILTLYAGAPTTAIEQLAPVRESLMRLFGAQHSTTQGASYHLALALAQVGRAAEAEPLLDALDPPALQRGVGGPSWPVRVAALKAMVGVQQGRPAARAALEASIGDLRRAGVQAWIVEPFARGLGGYDS
ncbi:MAG: protein kinase domain-containing protein [Panacagrimonas sp.]